MFEAKLLPTFFFKKSPYTTGLYVSEGSDPDSLDFSLSAAGNGVMLALKFGSKKNGMLGMRFSRIIKRKCEKYGLRYSMKY